MLKSSLKKTVLVAVLAFGCGIATHALAEPQPRMRAALRSLEAALVELKAASADKGGHRVKAIALTQQAIDEVKAGIEFDNKH